MDAKEFIEIAARQEIDERRNALLVRSLERNESRASSQRMFKELNRSASPRTIMLFRAAQEQRGGLVEDREAMLEALPVWGQSIAFVGKSLRSDRQLFMLAVRHSHCALHFACDELKNDKELVLEAIKYYPFAFAYASEALRADRDVALPAALAFTRNLRHCSYDIRGDKNIVLQLIARERLVDPPTLCYALAHLWADKELLAATESREREKKEYRRRPGRH